MEGTSQAVLGSSDQRKVPPSLPLFLKSEKIPALFNGGKGPKYRPFRDFRPVPSAYRPGAQISNHRRVCTSPIPAEPEAKRRFPIVQESRVEPQEIKTLD